LPLNSAIFAYDKRCRNAFSRVGLAAVAVVQTYRVCGEGLFVVFVFLDGLFRLVGYANKFHAACLILSIRGVEMLYGLPRSTQRSSICLLYWYKSTNTDVRRADSTFRQGGHQVAQNSTTVTFPLPSVTGEPWCIVGVDEGLWVWVWVWVGVRVMGECGCSCVCVCGCLCILATYAYTYTSRIERRCQY